MRFTSSQFKHAEALLAELLRFAAPADLVISRYFRERRELGQADRAFIAQTLYVILRHLRTLSTRCGTEVSSRHLLLAALGCMMGFNRRELDSLLNESEAKWLAKAKAVVLADFPLAVQLDLPDWLFERLSTQFDEGELTQLAQSLNQPAPLDLRVNTIKIERDAVLARLRSEAMTAEACPYSLCGIRVTGNPSLARHPLFLDGSIEVQDEGSQLLGYLLQPKRGEMVADFCAGAGGKTLLLGALMRSQGRLYAFDVAPKRLAKMKPRLARSGLSNVHPALIESENDIKIKRLAGKLDRVLVDAPCSGLGTLRRNPDLKWRQSAESVAELSAKQARILNAAARLVKPGGRVVYATCSLLEAENEAIVSAFLAANPSFISVSADEILAKQGIHLAAPRSEKETAGKRLFLYPHRDNTDGFFAAVLERRSVDER